MSNQNYKLPNGQNIYLDNFYKAMPERSQVSEDTYRKRLKIIKDTIYNGSEYGKEGVKHGQFSARIPFELFEHERQILTDRGFTYETVEHVHGNVTVVKWKDKVVNKKKP